MSRGYGLGQRRTDHATRPQATLAVIADDDDSVRWLTITESTTNDSIQRRQKQWQPTHLGKRFGLMPPQDHKVSLCETVGYGRGGAWGASGSAERAEPTQSTEQLCVTVHAPPFDRLRGPAGSERRLR